VSRKDLCTSRRAAELLGVTPRTVQLWADAGILQSWKTPGGHRRFTLATVERLARKIHRGEHSRTPLSRRVSDPIRPVRVHVIEDKPSLQKLYAIKIRSWGLPVELRQSMDGYQGLLELGRFKPDLLILDLNLSGVDSVRMIRALAQQKLLQQMQLVVVAARQKPQTLRQIRAISQRIDVLPSPVPFAHLREKMETVVQKLSEQG